MSEFVELGDGVRCRIEKTTKELQLYAGDPMRAGPREGSVTTFELSCQKKDSGEAHLRAQFFQKEDWTDCEVWDLHLNPNTMRGKGIGSKALLFLAGEMWKRGCRRFSGWPVEDSIEFWKRAGAAEAPEKWTWAPGGED